jgi:hypothetical protein
MSCRHQPRQRDWRWDASSWQSAVRPPMEPCHAIRIPIIERLFMPLSSQTSACCDHGRTILQSHLLLGLWKSSQLSAASDSLLAALHELPCPPAFPGGARGLSEHLRRRRNLQCASSMPSHSSCFMAAKAPSTKVWRIHAIAAENGRDWA